jgi:hypothetical protein
MTRFCTSLIALIAAQIFQVTHAQNAQRVFEIASPSVLVVKTPTSQGSGVIFGVNRKGMMGSPMRPQAF